LTSHGPRPSYPIPTHLADEPKVLVLFCHPQAHRSRVNRVLRDAVVGLDGVTVHDLYERYPDGAIDVPFEQELLLRHGAVVMQHPFYWYSTPPLLKEWLDVVLEWGWAYGRGGTKLRGKTLLQAITTGAGHGAYGPDGGNRFTIPQLLAPMAQTAHLCGMAYPEPFVVHGTHRLDEAGIAAAAARYRQAVEALRGEVTR
jgi:glutathione-regulated potassium-efflux system ancillary protein KefG